MTSNLKKLEEYISHIELRSDSVNLIFVDPDCIDMRSLIGMQYDDNKAEFLIIASRGGHKSTHIEGIKAIEEWLAEVKSSC